MRWKAVMRDENSPPCIHECMQENCRTAKSNERTKKRKLLIEKWKNRFSRRRISLFSH